MALLAIFTVAIVATACTIALRLLRIPGGAPAAALCAGLLAGVFLGPAVLGRVAPDLHESLSLGSASQAESLKELQSRQAADIAALVAIDASPIAIAETQAEHAEDIAPLRESLDQARAQRRILFMTAAFGAALLWILFTAIASPVALAARRDDARIALAMACAAIVVTIALTFPLTLWLLGATRSQALAFAAACAVTMWVYDYRALASDTLRRASAPTGWIVGGALAMTALAVAIDSFEAVEIALALIVLALWIRTRRPVIRRSRRRRRLRWRAAWTIFAPSLVAICAAQLDFATLIGTADFWIATLIAIALGHDGRWLGSLLGLRIAGAPDDLKDRWQRSGVLLDHGAGVMQCAGALIILMHRAAPPALIGALLVTAAMIELFQPIRQPIARWMDRGREAGEDESV